MGARRGHAGQPQRLETGEQLPPTAPAERFRDLCDYLGLAQELGVDIHQVVSQAQQFTRGLHGSAQVRKALHGKDATFESIRQAWAAYVAEL
ncbi:MAG: hypothetical protein R3185_09040, partial [Candidatus Thermoplasmatota archaeon]|nr:hypothetical protein [Candidatus Thermoplasmatota archaeon]